MFAEVAGLPSNGIARSYCIVNHKKKNQVNLKLTSGYLYLTDYDIGPCLIQNVHVIISSVELLEKFELNWYRTLPKMTMVQTKNKP